MNSWTLSNGLWLGADVDDIVDWFLEHQLDDGGWNASGSKERPSPRSTPHSTPSSGCWTINSPPGTQTVFARPDTAGRNTSYPGGLFQKLSTGKPFNDWTLSLAHPRRAY